MVRYRIARSPKWQLPNDVAGLYYCDIQCGYTQRRDEHRMWRPDRQEHWARCPSSEYACMFAAWLHEHGHVAEWIVG